MVTETCLGCICEAVSGCNRTTTCAGDVCGLFRITWAYWADSGKPTIGSEPPTSETGIKCGGLRSSFISSNYSILNCIYNNLILFLFDDCAAYRNCVSDPYCAASSVQGYMTRFGQVDDKHFFQGSMNHIMHIHIFCLFFSCIYKDCNNDGVINCYDHAAIHMLGGYGCKGQQLPQKYGYTFNQCIGSFLTQN